MMPSRFLACVVCAALAVSSVPARADRASLEAAAKAHFERGQSLSAQSRFAEALAEFSAGYELSRKPLFLFNMAECARQAGDRARARANYERYLAEDPAGRLADTAQSRLMELGGERVVEPEPAREPAVQQVIVRELPPAPPRPSFFTPLRTAALAVGIAGFTTLLIAAPLYSTAKNDYDRLVIACTVERCESSQWAEPQARAYASYAFFTITGLLAAVDLGLWIASARQKPSTSRAKLGAAGLAVTF